jgi:hypothetical protein
VVSLPKEGARSGGHRTSSSSVRARVQRRVAVVNSEVYAMNAAGFGPVIDVQADEADGGHPRELTVAFVQQFLHLIEPTQYDGIISGCPFPPGSKVELVQRTLQRRGDVFGACGAAARREALGQAWHLSCGTA